MSLTRLRGYERSFVASGLVLSIWNEELGSEEGTEGGRRKRRVSKEEQE